MQNIIPIILSISVLTMWIGIPIAIGFFIASIVTKDPVVRIKRRKVALWSLTPVYLLIFCLVVWGILGFIKM